MDALAVLLALVALAMLPCLVILIVFADSLLTQIARSVRRRSTGSRPELELEIPPLEQIAGDLHRLGAARLISTPGSTRFIAVTRAYDRRLIHACHALGVPQHLHDLEGIDLDLERIRVEGSLIASGFVLGGVDIELGVDGRQDHC